MKSAMDYLKDELYRFVSRRRDGVFLDFKSGKEKNPIFPSTDFLGRHTRDVMPQEVAEKQVKANRACFGENKVATFEVPLEVSGEKKFYSASTVAFGKNPLTACGSWPKRRMSRIPSALACS